MEPKNYTKAIREFIITNFLYGDRAGLTDNTSFLDSGIIDSTGMLELILFIENTYQTKIAPEEMLPENLDSVNRVSGYLNRKLLAAQVVSGP